MLIGIMSDSHDNMDAVRKAVALFNERKVDRVLHAGDFTSGFTFRILKDLVAPFTGIFGNNDGDILLLDKMSSGRIHKQPYECTIEEKRLVMIHEHHLVDALAASGHYDMVVYGHIHRPVAEYRGSTLLVNPGETCGWLHGRCTVALLDMETLGVEIVGL